MPIAEEQIKKLERAYQILNVPHFASAHAIKRAYRQLTKRWHPDRYPSGSSSHDEASLMMKFINGAYKEIQHAPLRYYSGGFPRVQQRVRRTNPVASSTADAARQASPRTDHLEFWVRFVCGLFAGLLVSFQLFLYLFAFDGPTITTAIVLGGVVLACGYGAARYGDKFWRSILKYWWIWS